MSALLLITAADEPSKVPFFIIGGALAIWAVILATIGLSRPSFPSNRAGQRGVIALTAVLVVIAIGAAILTVLTARPPARQGRLRGVRALRQMGK